MQTQTGITNAEFATTDKQFREACRPRRLCIACMAENKAEAKKCTECGAPLDEIRWTVTLPTARQASKFRHRKGAAYKTMKGQK